MKYFAYWWSNHSGEKGMIYADNRDDLRRSIGDTMYRHNDAFFTVIHGNEITVRVTPSVNVEFLDQT